MGEGIFNSMPSLDGLVEILILEEENAASSVIISCNIGCDIDIIIDAVGIIVVDIVDVCIIIVNIEGCERVLLAEKCPFLTCRFMFHVPISPSPTSSPHTPSYMQMHLVSLLLDMHLKLFPPQIPFLLYNGHSNMLNVLSLSMFDEEDERDCCCCC